MPTNIWLFLVCMSSYEIVPSQRKEDPKGAAAKEISRPSLEDIDGDIMDTDEEVPLVTNASVLFVI